MLTNISLASYVTRHMRRTTIMSIADTIHQQHFLLNLLHNLHYTFSPLFFSDGVGRTGTFICLHSQLERLKTEGVVDFFQAVKSARIKRAGLVPDAVCYGVLLCLLCIMMSCPPSTGPLCLLS